MPATVAQTAYTDVPSSPSTLRVSIMQWTRISPIDVTAATSEIQHIEAFDRAEHYSLSANASWAGAWRLGSDEDVLAGYYAVGWMFTFRRKRFVGS